MSIKKLTALILIFIFVGTFPVFAGSVSTYDILKEENDSFVERLAQTGLPYVKINEFLTDLDSRIETLQIPEERKYMEGYFLNFLFELLLESEDHAEFSIAFDSAFQVEFNYMLENNMALPEAFERLFVVAMGELIKKDEPIYEHPMYNHEDESEYEDYEENSGSEVNSENNIKEEENKKTGYFSDLEGYDWAEESINYLYENDIMKGYGDNSFRPSVFLTRAEGTKIVCKSFLKSGYVVLESAFSDIKKEDWYYKNVVNAEYFSLFSQMYKNNFSANQNMTRQEFCTLAYRAYLIKFGFFETKNPGIDFFDSSQFSSYAYEPITKMQKAQILNGDGKGYFNPCDNITRAEAAKIIKMLLEYGK